MEDESIDRELLASLSEDEIRDFVPSISAVHLRKLKMLVEKARQHEEPSHNSRPEQDREAARLQHPAVTHEHPGSTAMESSEHTPLAPLLGL